MSGLFLFLLSAWVGYLLCLFFCDPINSTSVKKRRPRLAFKNIEVVPYVRIHFKKKTYHLHHWLFLSVITIVGLIVWDGFQHAVVNGAAIGGIIQGLRYPDRFQFKHPRNNRNSIR